MDLQVREIKYMRLLSIALLCVIPVFISCSHKSSQNEALKKFSTRYEKFLRQNPSAYYELIWDDSLEYYKTKGDIYQYELQLKAFNTFFSPSKATEKQIREKTIEIVSFKAVPVNGPVFKIGDIVGFYPEGLIQPSQVKCFEFHVSTNPRKTYAEYIIYDEGEWWILLADIVNGPQ